MYTLSVTGGQETNAFEDIVYSNVYNDRFQQAVYQRGWDKVQATVYDFNGATTDPVLQTQRNVAVKAAWSSVYNDVAVPYIPGVGFSIKSVPADDTQLNTTFRLPKNDTHFDYYTDEDASDVGDRTNVSAIRGSELGKLASDNLKNGGECDALLSFKDASTGGNNLGNNDKTNKLYRSEEHTS